MSSKKKKKAVDLGEGQGALRAKNLWRSILHTRDPASYRSSRCVEASPDFWQLVALSSIVESRRYSSRAHRVFRQLGS